MPDADLRARLPEPIATERLRLRAPNHADIAPLARLANNIKISDLLARLPHPCHHERTVEFIDDIARPASGHTYCTRTRNNTFIGYWPGAPYRDKRYGTEAVTARVAAADAAGCMRLAALSRSHNRASLAVPAWVGFAITDEVIGNCGRHEGVTISRLMRERPI